ncbi:MAG TPA: hybrid sensor histidine kinase/response regulator [Gammaproteobacteria bacterium]|nr:hybrid sensor histidine kinase/response regulator [Gammaproteobacteria bacterium]
MTSSQPKATTGEVQAEQIRLLYNHFTYMSLANVPSMVIFGYMISGGVDIGIIYAWICLIFSSVALRLRLTSAFRRTQPGLDQMPYWGKRAVRSTFLSGLAWAIIPPLATFSSQGLFLAVVFLLSIMVTIFLGPGSTYKPAYFSFSIPILGSVGLTFLLYIREYWYIGIAVMMGLTILLHLSRLQEKTLIESIRIRFEKEELLEELKKQKRQAEQANIAKSKFLAAASHDLRQPLHALGLYLDTLQTQLNTKRQEELVDKMGIATAALNDLFQSLLDISKLDAGIVEPAIIDCPINEIYKRLEVRFTPMAKAKNLEISFNSGDDVVVTDPLLLERILDNLIGNAIRYTNSGKITVAAVKDKDSVQVAVADTGPGIPVHEQENIFKEFYQLHNPERDRTKGLGLGLSIVSRLCALLSHPLKLESEPKRGTKFTLSLPPGNPANIAKAPQQNVRPGWDIKGSNILVIDDEAEIRDAMRQLLSNWGCNPVCVDSADEAKAAVLSGLKPDLIIADYRLRESQTGVDAIRTIIEALRTKVPGILITGDTAPERLQEAARSGFKLLHKPVNPGQLRMVVNVLLA